jgi:hypothetical protein
MSFSRDGLSRAAALALRDLKQSDEVTPELNPEAANMVRPTPY